MAQFLVAVTDETLYHVVVEADDAEQAEAAAMRTLRRRRAPYVVEKRTTLENAKEISND